MPELKPAYLIWGDDDARIDAWRLRVRARAEEEAPDASLEVLRDERLSGEIVAEALGALTLATGRRYVLVDHLDGWNDKEAAPIADALAALPQQTTAVFLAGKAPARLVKAVERCGGDVHECSGPTSRGFTRWTAERARELGIALDAEAAQALVAHVGQSQRRLRRELEKLAIYAGEGGSVDVETVEALAATSAEKKVYELADALIADDRAQALRIAEELRDRGEDMMAILFGVLRRVQECHGAAAMLSAGVPVKQVEQTLRMPPWLAKRVVSQAREADVERLERAIRSLADLDWAIRGGADRDPDTALTLALAGAAT